MTQTVLNALRGKNSQPIELTAIIPDFANPWKKREEEELKKARPYDSRSARAFNEAITLGLVPESILSMVDLDLLARAVKAGER